MARPCIICTHPKRAEIDAALRVSSHRVVAKRFGISDSAANRHKVDHLKSAKRNASVASEAGSETPTPAALHPLEQAKRDTEVLDLRLAGLSPRAIAVKVGLTRAMVRDILQRALDDAAADREDRAGHLLEVELSRLDRLHASLWDRATDPAMATVDVPAENEAGMKAYDGQDKAVDRVLKIAERRHKLLGLEKAPEPPAAKGGPADGAAQRTIVEIHYPAGIAPLPPLDGPSPQPPASPHPPTPPTGS